MIRRTPLGGPFHDEMALLLALVGVEIVSKKLDYQSGRPDLNRRLLDSQARIRRLGGSEGVERRASHQQKPLGGIAVGRGRSDNVGSRDWLPKIANAGESLTRLLFELVGATPPPGVRP